MSDIFNFDAKTIRFLERQQAQADAIQHAINGALNLLCDLHGLEGTWRLDWANRCMVRTDPHGAVSEQTDAVPAGRNGDRG